MLEKIQRLKYFFEGLDISNKLAIVSLLVTIIIAIITLYPKKNVDEKSFISQNLNKLNNNQQIFGNKNTITNQQE